MMYSSCLLQVADMMVGVVFNFNIYGQLNSYGQLQSEFFIPMNAVPEYSTSDKNFLGTDFFLSKLLRYNGKHAYRHRQ